LNQSVARLTAAAWNIHNYSSVLQEQLYETTSNQGKLSIDWTNCFRLFHETGILDKKKAGQQAAAFLNAFVDSCMEMAEYGLKKTGLRSVVLSGNLYEADWIAKMITRGLRDRGFEVLSSPDVPFDESPISIGQICYANSVRL